MDKVLKQRLIGATILIALAVIFLPMLLVGPEDEMASDSMDFDVPPMPADARAVRRIPLNPEAARVREADVPAMAERPVGETPLTDESPADDQSDAIRSSNEPDPGAIRPADEIVLRPEVRTESEAPVRTEPRVQSPSVAGTIERPPPAFQDQANSSGGSWVVQVASFGSADSAASVRQRLEALGHDVIQDQISQGGNTLIRLKTGPYASEDAAGRARAQIGTTVQGVSPIVRRSELPAAAATSGESGFAVQVGSFASQANAERETQRLIGLGFDAFRFSEDAAGRQIWRVRVGPVDARSQAAALQSRLRDNAGVEGLIVSQP